MDASIAVSGSPWRWSARVVAATIALTVGIPGCTSDCGEGPGIDNAIASTDRWLRLTGLPAHLPDVDGSFEAGVQVAVVDEEVEGTPHVERVALHSTFVPGIEDAIEDGDALFLGMTATGPEREDVGLVITRSPISEHHFVGECMAEGETLLRERLEG